MVPGQFATSRRAFVARDESADFMGMGFLAKLYGLKDCEMALRGIKQIPSQ
jgi:hypothetical protein